jgi:hypothetical protein
MPDGLLARAEAVLADGETMNGLIVAAIEELVARREGGSTKPAAARGSTTRARKPKADTAPPAQFREPESASDIMAAIRRRREAR